MKYFKDYFSACLIVKNEEKNLQRCLDSLKEYCSQIVVVDTGSKDKSPIIAQLNSCDLFFHAWNSDFSEARNYALKYATNPWIISIDADEVIYKVDLSEKQLKDEKIGGFEVEIINYLSNSTDGPTSKHYYSRIFRNKKSIKFQDGIHEQIRPSIENNGLKIIKSNTIFLHYGYQNTSQEKKNRNQELLKIQSEKRGDDWDIFQLAESEFALLNNDSAKEHYLKILKSKELPEPNKDKAKIRLGQIYLSNSEFDKVDNILDFYSIDKDLEGLRIFVLAGSKLSQGDILEAEKLYDDKIISESNMVDKLIIDKAKKAISQLKKQ